VLQAGRSGLRNPTKSMNFLIYLILLGPRVYSASDRNEYQKQKNNVSGSRARPVRRADKLAAICEPIV
jgi:hypothetical protein